MNRNIVLELFSIALVALFWIPGALAYPQYLDAYNSTFNTNASCGVCHVNPTDGGTLNSYGMQFKNQTDHTTDPGAALAAIGPNPDTTSTATATNTSTATWTATSNVTETPIVTTPIPTETALITETPLATETTIPAGTTPRTPGFGYGIFIAGLLACYFILKRHNNN